MAAGRLVEIHMWVWWWGANIGRKGVNRKSTNQETEKQKKEQTCLGSRDQPCQSGQTSTLFFPLLTRFFSDWYRGSLSSIFPLPQTINYSVALCTLYQASHAIPSFFCKIWSASSASSLRLYDMKWVLFPWGHSLSIGPIFIVCSIPMEPLRGLLSVINQNIGF